MKTFNFSPSLQGLYTLDTIYDPVRTKKELEAEPMLFSSSWEFAQKNGGPITNEIMDKLLDIAGSIVFGRGSSSVLIDTRVQMLMPGWWPSIPNWHCDFIPRDINTGQPVLGNKDRDEWNFTCLLSTVNNISCTEFIVDYLELEYDPSNVWVSVNESINKLDNEPNIYILNTGEIMMFGPYTLHRAVKAKCPGWRYFFRCSVAPTFGKQNEIRKQVQVYVPENTGW